MPLDGLTGSGNVALQNLGRHLTSDTGRTDNQVLMIFLQFHPVGTRTVIETVDPRVADQLDEVLVAIGILGQYDQVVTAQVLLMFLQTLIATTSHIHLTAEDGFERFESFFLTTLVHVVTDIVKFLDAEHITVVGDGHAFHAVVDCLIDEPFDTRLSVENGVVGMYV